MKCPLFYGLRIHATGVQHYEAENCLKGECAWWDGTAEKCVVLQLAFEIDKVQDRLERILNKMPHEEQFGR